MDLNFTKPSEVVELLCQRLRKERLALQMTQAELAARAGVGVNTLSNLENGQNTSFETLVRIAMVLGRVKELEALFQPKLDSLDDLRRYEESNKRYRARRKS
ncbi:helix-turn-helix domain-containing protein [Oceanisphaera avium]|uniref:Transcriptional regulator n=1 Tax=Oceanisphaera avium TaxID=1903694 RepID=A0A1Y0D0G5_9GAMM|nr:helix-turn-helix transcriptional regulator [Oceanisphaera avium]ART80596.1 transcriptional regulator [Oceanisphaera avium]